MIKIALLKFITDNKFIKRDAEKLRGFLGKIYREDDFFHNHKETGESIYRFPLIQYKVIDGYLSIIAFKEAVKILCEKFLNIEEIVIDDKKYTNFETQLSVNDFNISMSDSFINYSFDSLWLPIKQENYLDYINSKIDLNKVLQNNILEVFKGMGITADKTIIAKGEYKEKSVNLNNINHFGFTGRFETNVLLPDYIGLGKSKAFGFGTIKQEKN